MSGERIRLLKFISNFCIGGTERQFAIAATHLDPVAFHLGVACFAATGPFLGGVVARGIPVEVYPIDSLVNLRSWRERRRLARSLRERRVEIVHTYGFYPNLFAVPAARYAGARVVIGSIRDSGDLLSLAKRRVQRAVLRLADHIVVNAEAVRAILVRAGYPAGKITVIHNGIDAGDEPAPDGGLHDELGLAQDVPLVTVVSRLSGLPGFEFKGIRPFLDAVRLIPDDGTRFLIAGDGPLRAELEAYAERTGVAPRVTFLGFRSDVARILAESAIAVLPSLSEGLSNSLLEAMAAGIPVVATRVGGTPEALDDGEAGWLVPPGDARALASAISALLFDRSLAAQLGDAARRRVLRHFSIPRMVEATESLYRDLYAGKRAMRGSRIPTSAAAEGGWS